MPKEQCLELLITAITPEFDFKTQVEISKIIIGFMLDKNKKELLN